MLMDLYHQPNGKKQGTPADLLWLCALTMKDTLVGCLPSEFILSKGIYQSFIHSKGINLVRYSPRVNIWSIFGNI